MHGSSTSELDAASQLLTWSDQNTRGHALASKGAWEDATSAFFGAADALASESDVASHEALALVLNNLAHGCYRVGRTDEAIAHAQRACALRAALVGEDAIVVARARIDLAVMLASTGRVDEGMALVTRAIAVIERTAGDESLHLQVPLENAARLAMAAGQPSSAEPYLLRLHALLGAHDLPTDRADLLLAGIARYRASARVTFALPAAEAVHSEHGADVVEDDLDVVEQDLDIVEEDLETITVDDTIFEETSPSTDVLGMDFELVDMTPVNNPALTAPAPVANVASAVVNGLGFEVRYGTQTDEDALASLESVRPPMSVRVPTPPPAPAIPVSGTHQRPEPAPPAGNTRLPAQTSNNAPRPSPAAEEVTRERRFRLPKLRFG
jgi:hypothetical protein